MAPLHHLMKKWNIQCVLEIKVDNLWFTKPCEGDLEYEQLEEEDEQIKKEAKDQEIMKILSVELKMLMILYLTLFSVTYF